MRIKETKIYTYAELSDGAKEKARDWYREACASDTDWAESITEKGGLCDTIARYCGWTIGKPRHQRTGLAIYWSGFSSQGDGLCFEGTWRASDVDRAGYLKDFGEHLTNAKWLALVDRFAALAKTEPTMYGSAVHRGHYSHSGCTSFDWGHDNAETADQWDKSHLDTEFMDVSRVLMDEFYRALETEYDYQTSDEAVAERIEANGHEFTEEGEHV